jgi:hypothetical protein
MEYNDKAVGQRYGRGEGRGGGISLLKYIQEYLNDYNHYRFMIIIIIKFLQ